MKTLPELFELVAVAVAEDQARSSSLMAAPESEYIFRGRWFITFSGHVNNLRIQFYRNGWKADSTPQDCDVYVTDEGVQEAYWFIKNRLM